MIMTQGPCRVSASAPSTRQRVVHLCIHCSTAKMPVTTRSKNSNVSSRIYRPKNVPKQKHFPHRRKIVRRPDGVQDTSGKKQMRFLPEKMKRQNTIQDSEDEGLDLETETEDETEGGVLVKNEPTLAEANPATGRGTKRNSGAVTKTAEDGQINLAQVSPKRRRKSSTSNRRKPIEPTHKGHAEYEREGHIKPKFQRQSTMTQIIDGRQPLSGSSDPEFKPVKRSLRTSLGGRNSKQSSKDRKQRTLTQMVPGLVPINIGTEGEVEQDPIDIEAEERESQEFNDEVARRLMEDGFLQQASDSVLADSSHRTPVVTPIVQESADIHVAAPDVPISQVSDDEDEDEYHPTQHIDAPATNKCGTLRATTRKLIPGVSNKGQTPARTRFGLLSTPEKRKVLEIPSSQSPPESPLSTQDTPHKLKRIPLKPRSANSIKAIESHSKGKQVSFQNGPQKQTPRPTLRKFASTIPDSEDEGEELTDSEEAAAGVSIGAETQAMLHAIDQACANTSKDAAWAETSEELGGPVSGCANERFEELGDQDDRPIVEDGNSDDVELSPLPLSSPLKKPKRGNVISRKESPPCIPIPSSPPIEDLQTQTPTPQSAEDGVSCKEEPAFVRPSRKNLSSPIPAPKQHESQDASPLHDIQVPRSPPDTQTSRYSEAAQQLHSEYQAYSQYRFPGPPASSMHVSHDPGFSYQASPFPSKPPTLHHASSSAHISQATTVDITQVTTPRKLKAQAPKSASVTPHKVFSSQPIISPSKPPPLFIPSSFPSPTRVVMEGWSSPIVEKKEGLREDESEEYGTWRGEASIEEFSIPPPPPLEWMGDNEEL